jgi:predicted ATP-binding protein involved in virulence
MAYWQVRAKLDDESYITKFIDGNKWNLLSKEHIESDVFRDIINSIQEEDILFLADGDTIEYYARCKRNSFDGIHVEVDEWKKLLEPIKSLNSGNYIKTISMIKNNEKIDNLLQAMETLKIYKLKNLKITNFRLFEKLEVEFNEDVNVIIANNGAGKTTLLDAIALGFGSMLTHLPNINGIGFSNDKRDLRINRNNRKEPYLRIELTSTQNVRWDRTDKRDRSKTTAKRVPNGYGLKELETFMDTIIDSENEGNDYIMPLIMYYGTCRNCFDAPLRKVNFQKEFNRFESLSGALKGASNFSRLFQWFDAMENLERREIQNRRDFDYQLPELENVRDSITSMLKGFQNPRIKTRPLRFMIDRVEDDGLITELQIEQLSAGYKAVLAMVMDISARMSEANPHLGNKSEAIILIDELDLHLHPKWQQTILSDLLRTFPNAQFIVTTHSPQMLTTVKKEQVFILTDNRVEKPFETAYAKRSIVALEDLMGTDSMPPLKEVLLLDKYLDKIHHGDIDSKEVLGWRELLNELYGEEYQQLRIADMIINKHIALRNK